MIVVGVPASSANLGPGFDSLGMALALRAEIGVLDDDSDGPIPAGGRAVDERHPADGAFRYAGGRGQLWVRSPIPVGRGLGFSGAMRVGGVVAALAQRGFDEAQLEGARASVLSAAVELEGHADNAAASLCGGVVATAGGIVVPVRLGFVPAVVLWVPGSTTSTQRSRARIGGKVAFEDAVFNVGRTALLVAALTAGDVVALRTATEDRLHQDERFAATVSSRAALAAGLEAGAWAGWLSGSGPAVAFLCDPATADEVAAALSADRLADQLGPGTTRVLPIDPAGATVHVS